MRARLARLMAQAPLAGRPAWPPVEADEVLAAGWTPGPPAVGRADAVDPPPPSPDAAVHGEVTGEVHDQVHDQVHDEGDDASAARRALAAAMATYTAAHGHPLGAGDLATPRRFRLAVGARVAVAAVVALGLVVGAVAVRAGQRSAASVPVAGASSALPGGVGADGSVPAGAVPAGQGDGLGSAAGDASRAVVVVHVVGEVAAPGVVLLEPGARAADAVAAAGGPTASADLTAINLARVLVDGEQVVVPAPGDASTTGAAPGASGGTGAAGSGRVDLNQADAAAFDTLPGIGPVLAERIVAWRDEHGRFTAVEELTEVTGIGPALLAGVRDLVQVG